MTTTEVYLDQSRFDALIDALLNVESCPGTGKVTRDQIVIALGEAGNIWPLSIMPVCAEY